jgi:hypothetical protein
MGVDFYTCANCSYNFPDCGEYFGCSCGEHFCSTKCGGMQVIQEESPPEVDDDHYREEMYSCILCRKETATDHDLLHFILGKYGVTREQALEMYQKESK